MMVTNGWNGLNIIKVAKPCFADSYSVWRVQIKLSTWSIVIFRQPGYQRQTGLRNARKMKPKEA